MYSGDFVDSRVVDLEMELMTNPFQTTTRAAPLVRVKVKITVKNAVRDSQSSATAHGDFDYELGFDPPSGAAVSGGHGPTSLRRPHHTKEQYLM